MRLFLAPFGDLARTPGGVDLLPLKTLSVSENPEEEDQGGFGVLVTPTSRVKAVNANSDAYPLVQPWELSAVAKAAAVCLDWLFSQGWPRGAVRLDSAGAVVFWQGVPVVESDVPVLMSEIQQALCRASVELHVNEENKKSSKPLNFSEN